MKDKDSHKVVSTPCKGKDKSHLSDLQRGDEILRDKEEAMSVSETLDCTQGKTEHATDGTTHAGTSRRDRDHQLDRDQIATRNQTPAVLASPLVILRSRTVSWV